MIDFTYEEKTDLESALMQLYTILQHLRSDDGCPWDREQTPKTVATHLIGETYEYLDAVLASNNAGQSEELGDVLLNALMLLEMKQEVDGKAGIEAINQVCEKLIRRHPHVFSSSSASTSSQVMEMWEVIKQKVEGKTHDIDDFFSRLPSSLPPLEMANEIQKKIQKVGFDWPDIQGVFDKVKEELEETRIASLHPEDKNEDLELELGDLLFSVVNLCRFLGYNPSLALHRSNHKMRRRFNALYKKAGKEGIPLDADHLAEMDSLWEEVKAEERQDSD